MAMPTSPEIIELERVASIIINAHQAAQQFEMLPTIASVADILMRDFESLISYEYKFYNPAFLNIITEIKRELRIAHMYYTVGGFSALFTKDELQILLLWIDKEFKEYYADIINRINCAF